MLQQTRVAAVLPYYERFLERFPDVRALAQADLESVLALWAGLGYYSRARNLHVAAKQILERHGGNFPRERSVALELAGIGNYTSAAILSIAFGAPHAVLDGNVARVLARLGAIRGDLRQPRRWKALSRAADVLLARHSAGDWNQAMMELGATVCTPRAPRCTACPIATYCRANTLGIAGRIPAARTKRTPVNLAIFAAVLLDASENTLLLAPSAKLSADELFSRMWQFPAEKISGARVHSSGSQLRDYLQKHIDAGPALAGAVFRELDSSVHTVTYRNITLIPFLVRVRTLPLIEGARVLPLANVERLAVSSATRKIAAAALKHVASSRTAKSRSAVGC